MCYDAAQLAFRVYKEAVRLKASQEEIDQLREKWEQLEKNHTNYYHVSGFSHPKLLAYFLDDGKIDIDYFYWGLIPFWVKDEEQAEKVWNSTINARGETIFEKPSFRDVAKDQRCVIPLTGFYEFHHKNNKVFPYFIRPDEEEVLFVAGLYSDWVNEATGELLRTLTIVTTKANRMMARIHNNPKQYEARMPLLLTNENVRQWLDGNKDELQSIVKKHKAPELRAWTVGKLRGKDYVGNNEQIFEKVEYPELK